MSTTKNPVCAAELGAEKNIVEDFLRMDRMPHIWCPGCGIGTTVNCFARAIKDCGTDPKDIAIVSGIGCTGRVAGYLKLDSFHTTHGRGITFATGLKLANPKLKVVVYSGDGDLSAIGGNHLIHAARRNIDITVVCVNNFIYGMTGGQVAPTTPLASYATTSPFGQFEDAFNLAHLLDSCGATYVARWTSFHVRQTAKAMAEAMAHPGFSFVEILAPCPTLFLRKNRFGDGLSMMKLFKERSKIMNGCDTKDTAIKPGFPELIIGKFVDRERADFDTNRKRMHQERLGSRFIDYVGPMQPE